MSKENETRAKEIAERFRDFFSAHNIDPEECSFSGQEAIDNLVKNLTRNIDAALDEEGKPWRRLLWLRHGCEQIALYGDDGEMQCNKCMLDFRRMTASEIDDHFLDAGQKAFAKHLKGHKP